MYMKHLLVLVLLVPSVVMGEDAAEAWARYEAVEQQKMQTHALNGIARSLRDQRDDEMYDLEQQRLRQKEENIRMMLELERKGVKIPPSLRRATLGE